MEKLLKVEEVAEICGVRPATVYKWIQEKRIPSVSLSSRCRRVRRRDLEAFIEGRLERRGKR
ncbi:MAG: excisionase [Deltaproteobacteria bacterium]|nr:MAG: excisionase [Deltaproteobacteria bacterium]